MKRIAQTKSMIQKYSLKCLEIKTTELKDCIPNLHLEDVLNFYLDGIEKSHLLKNTNDAVYYILNISGEDIIQYLNLDNYLMRKN